MADSAEIACKMWLFEAPVLVQGGGFLSLTEWQRIVKNQPLNQLSDAYEGRATLGAYIEALAAEAIKQGGCAELLAQNIQFFKDRQTIGEMDFLLKESGKVLHLELAAKFYLCIGDIHDMAHWVGTNVRDSMARKHTKLTQSQLLLSKNPLVAAQLGAQGLPLPDEAKALLKGQLFYTFAQWQSSARANWAAPEHAAGWWLEANNIGDLSGVAERWYTCSDKREWLLTGNAPPENKTLSTQELQKQLSRLAKPVMVHAIINGACAQNGFVVPQGWQEAARAAHGNFVTSAV